ncbi:MAG: glycoside hydrolase family 16 protein, partial [Armatimonadota bacterium]|nr:glycoside hydrolase family 16 protein [Armatimonadota bacterium]
FLLGGGAVVATGQISAKGAQATLAGDGQTLRVVFPAAQGEQAATLKPAQGRWDLRDYLQVRVKVKNDGQTPVTPRARVESNGGPSDWISAAPLAPGAETEIIVPFINAAPINLNQKGADNRVTNDAVSGVTVAVENAGAANAAAESALQVQSIKAGLPPLDLPDWLGKRPPVENYVEGDWVKTLDDEFDGPAIDDTVWNIYGPNHWDKKSHWSKDNVILGDGVVRLRYEKKRGFHNDDPTEKESDYAAGFLETYGKWVQRYGYFESRMKLPKAPGLWPALWMMPDRGAAAGPRWKRQDTANGGMEFDIMEHLTRWGPNRYNIAQHWDGYGKDHKSNGSGKVYLQPDKDGFITTGLLWTPGSVVYYGNGKEVLRWEDPRIANVPEILMFTLPMGGWDNSPLDDAQLPSDFIIDYVRVWQRKDLASPTDGKQAPVDETKIVVPPAPNAPPATGEIFTTAEKVTAAIRTEGGATVSVAEADGAKVLQAQFPAGNGYPGFEMPVTEGGWNLSAFGGAQVDVTNTGESEVVVALRVDNEGDWKKSPWNTESVSLKPGETKTIQVTFGKSYGGNPGFALNPANIIAFKIFAVQPKQAATVVVKNLKAFGTPAAK